MKKGAYWIDRCIIESPYYIGLCQTEEQFRHELKRLKVPDYKTCEWIPDGKDAVVIDVSEVNGDKKSIIVSIRKRKSSTSEGIIGLLIHESVHVWQRIKNNLNEAYPSNEFEAYSIQMIALKLITAYKMK